MWRERTKLVVKDEGLQKLEHSHVLVVGLGGVGAFVAEFLARAGVGHLTIGQPKAELVAQRLRDINPHIVLEVINDFLTPETAYDLVDSRFDYVADCIDSISPKISLLRACHDSRVKVISSMGAGGVLDPSKVKVADISQTRDCPLARTIRKRLKKEGIQPKFKAVFSLELPDKDMMALTDGANFKRSYYGTMSYMPALFGIHVAGVIVRKLIE